MTYSKVLSTRKKTHFSCTQSFSVIILPWLYHERSAVSDTWIWCPSPHTPQKVKALPLKVNASDSRQLPDCICTETYNKWCFKSLLVASCFSREAKTVRRTIHGCRWFLRERVWSLHEFLLHIRRLWSVTPQYFLIFRNANNCFCSHVKRLKGPLKQNTNTRKGG